MNSKRMCVDVVNVYYQGHPTARSPDVAIGAAQMLQREPREENVIKY